MKEIRLLASYNWNATFIVQAHGGEDAIKHHPFFRDVKWKELEERKVKPPFKPKFVSLCLYISVNTYQLNLAEEPEGGDKFWYRIYKRGPCSDPCQPRNYQNHPAGQNGNIFVAKSSRCLFYFRTSLMGSVSQTQYLERCWPSQWRSTETCLGRLFLPGCHRFNVLITFRE